jgi:hypothetical protein
MGAHIEAGQLDRRGIRASRPRKTNVPSRKAMASPGAQISVER